ncbi:hypothetical protein F5B22DRAFT_564300 [Xylaria bambusicola]|uniref:uncharacterized protein n=1 Tax=Xylaria bambusicola TaxID=326684 RepID=UPI002007D75A|nr:uncharacterized protein F5B22DRAFT_564300 [Xylaria bambusicola]KAI0503124.1 hypothetical protein F5B22DRAFT_564300 [Xylaria bambusicola]
MQPLYGSTSCTVVRTVTHTYRPMRNSYSLLRRVHEGSHLIRRHASSQGPNRSRKPVTKPLPYQPTQPKAADTQQKQYRRNEKAPLSDLMRERWFAMLGFGTALACLGYFTTSLTMYWRTEPAPCYPLGCEPTVPTGRPSIQSPYEFDMHLDKSEWRYGITRLRRELGASVRGHVLEVAIGTGRNFEFYGWDAVTASLLSPEEQRKKTKKQGKSSSDDDAVLSFTGVDISPGMLDIALLRVRQVVPHMSSEIPKKPSFAMLASKYSDDKDGKSHGHVVSLLSDRIRLLQSDVSSGLPSPPAPPSPSNSAPSTSSLPQKYDTIIQTFGLCSVQDPVSLLSTMAASLQPDTGRILLLEHGRSIWSFVNGLLDRGARQHHERFGCWWNRDIEVIVTEASRRIPGLEIVRLERPGWTTAGTHVVVELRVTKQQQGEIDAGKKEKATGWFPSVLSTKQATDESKKSN